MICLPSIDGRILRTMLAGLLVLFSLLALPASALAVAPLVAAPVPDTTVTEDSPPLSNYRDLNDVFSDAEDGGALAFVVASNDNPGLVTVTIDADSALDVSFAPNGSGSAEIVIRATDSELLSVTDTFVVFVSAVNDTPQVVAAIPDTTVLENSGPVDDYRDLRDVFDDVEDGSALAFTVANNSNPALVGVVVDTDSTLDLSFAPGDVGTATITVRATDSGGALRDESFTVFVHRTNLYVKPDGTGDHPTIQAAINAAVDGDTVTLAAGTFTGPGNRNIIFNGKSILLTSESGAAATIIDCENSDRGFELTNGEGPGAVVSGVTIANANQVQGGGVHISNASPTIIDNIIVNCTAIDGAGINCTNSSSLISGNLIMGNIASGEGGGIYTNATTATIAGNTIIENGSAAGGGNIHVRNSGGVTISECIIAYAVLGPGLACTNGAVPTVSCTNIFGNAGGDALCGTDGGGNFSANPEFCGPLGSGDVTLLSTSPCAPANNVCGTLIGSAGVACSPVTIASPIPDAQLQENGPTLDNHVDLNDVFQDAGGGSAFGFSIAFNSDTTLVGATIDADSALDLTPLAGRGEALVVVRATAGTTFLEDSLVVTVLGGNIQFTAERLWTGSVRPADAAQPMFRLVAVNAAAAPETLAAVTFTNTSTGAGTPAQLDASFSTMTLAADGGATVLPGGVPGGRTGTFSGGLLAFSGLEAVVPAGESLALTVTGGASLAARDGDTLDFALVDSTDVVLGAFASYIADWPLDPADVFPVDGMVVAQIGVNTLATSTFGSGTSRNVALDVVLPANGYSADTLNRLNVVNLGTAVDGADVTTVEGWVDNGDGVFDESDDVALGAFSFTGSRWELTGLSVAVPVSGIRVFVTVDISSAALEGRTIKLSLPSAPDLGVGMDSGNDGPIDAAVSNPSLCSISSTDRVVLVAAPLASGVVAPGATDVILAHVTATNRYAVPKQVTSLTFTNGSTSPGGATQAELDGELSVLQLRIDANDNGVLEDVSTDPVAGTAFFDGGVATFGGLAWDLPADASRDVFLTADVSLTGARDGDELGATIDGVFDIGFSDGTAVIAEWPVDSGAQQAIDGMLAAQVTNLDITAATLAPNDGPILALDVIVPANGYADDVLEGIELVNLGTAVPGDIADLRIWRDGGDGQFEAGAGDDTEVAPLVWAGASWKSPLIAEVVPAGGTRFFVGVTVSAAPTDSSSVRLAVPVGGLTMLSANDGPIDAAVESDRSLLLSSAPLLVSLEATPPATTVGQTVTVTMIARNVGNEPINGVTPSALTPVGDAVVTAVSGPVPPTVTLAAGATDTITWTYTAVAAGDVAWRGDAQGVGDTSGLVRLALEASSNTHRVFDQAGNVDLYTLSSMPFVMNRGQTDVVPLSLTFSPSGGVDASDVRITHLRFRLEDEAGSGIVPSDLLTRVVVSEGNTTYLVKTSLESSGSEVSLVLATPVVVPAIESATLAMRVDISPTTVIPQFRVVVTDAGWITASDAISGAPVTVSIQETSFPVQSKLGRIVAPPTELDVSPVASASRRVSWGQTDVPVLVVQLDNPGPAGLITDVSVSSFDVSVADTNGTPVTSPASVFSRMKVVSPSGTLADIALTPQDSSTITLSLTPLATVAAGAPVALVLSADIAAGAPVDAYRVALAGPFEARDANTGDALPVVFSVDPITGGDVWVEVPADTLEAGAVAAFPSAVQVGETAVDALTLTLLHPGMAGVSRVRIDGITLMTQNEQRNPLVPATYIERVTVLRAGSEIAVVTTIPSVGSAIPVPLPTTYLEPGEVLDLDVRVGVSASAPAGFIELIVPGSGVAAAEANAGAAIVLRAAAGQSFPLTSGLTQLVPPSTELVVGLKSRMPAALVADDGGVPVATLTFTNPAATGSSGITVDHLVVRGSDADFTPVTLGAFATRVSAYAGGALIGESDSLSVDSTTATIPLPVPLVVPAGESREVTLRADWDPGVGKGALRVGVDESDVGVQQPGSVLLQIRVEPQPGRTFPMWSEVGSFSGQGLADSYSNFPNPFAAGAEPTTFVYYLKGDARVTLRIRTPRGDLVKTLRDGEPRAAGLHQDDVWNGKNGRGETVRNGVYLAELRVEYVGGGSTRLLRKVAVVR